MLNFINIYIIYNIDVNINHHIYEYIKKNPVPLPKDTLLVIVIETCTILHSYSSFMVRTKLNLK